MNKNDIHPDDPQISALLREARVSPALPPRFQQNVWRRIENAEAPARSASWLDALAAWVLRPRLAFATAAVLLFAGILLGVREGSQSARHEAQARYLAEVAPATLR
ncbi:MAG TPA: hypothetical protein VIK53_14725 [Verrucomicrobiae bacterium]